MRLDQARGDVGSAIGPIDHPVPGALPAPDEWRLTRIITILTLLSAGLALEALTFAWATGDPAYAVQLALFVATAGWCVWARHHIADRGPSWVASRLVVVTLTAMVGLTLLEPSAAGSLAMAPLVAFLLAMPYLTDASMGRLGVGCWLACIGIAIMAIGAQVSGGVRANPGGVVPLLNTAVIAALLLYLLWGYRDRLMASSRDMARLIRLSRDVSETLDPIHVAQRLARHLQEATHADACVISAYRPEKGEVVAFASWPTELAGRDTERYSLDDYPLTREVLEDQRIESLSADDPTADPAEVRVLVGDGGSALLMVPLVARGQTIGLAEITRLGPPFRHVEIDIATSAASEAAMALENARLHEELRRQAFHDGMTRLANRALFTDRLDHALARSGRGPGRVAVLFADIDGFKAVNDQLGHVRGDQVLVAIAERISGCLRTADTVARLGGDEFAVLLEDQVDPGEAEHVARRIVDAVREPILLGETQVSVGISIGIAFSNADASTADALLRDADAAMYHAKAAGKARVEVFDPALRRGIEERRALKRSLRKAVQRDELRLQYQPVVQLSDGVVTGVEALVRWDAPGVQRRMPGDFIALSEENGSIVTIGRWVLEEACRQAQEWQVSAARKDLTVSVNLSARQFQDPALGRTLASAVAQSGLTPGTLMVEITESVLMQHTQRTIDVLAELRSEGVRVAVDDFGTGYSSLSYLQRFPVDVLKIDRSFVGTDDEPTSWVLAQAIVAMSQGLGLRVIAEGIERQDQLRVLRAMGCSHGQGYLFSPPIDASGVDRLLGLSAEARATSRMGLSAIA
jgi:diguanylate cyclase (GGDEF)-like protein